MTRVVVQRGSASAGSSSSSSNSTNRSNAGPTPSHEAQEQVPLEVVETGRSENLDVLTSDKNEDQSQSDVGSEEGNLTRINGVRVIDEGQEENDVSKSDDYALKAINGGSYPPAPPPPAPKPSSTNSNSRSRTGSSRRANVWPVLSTVTLPTGSGPSSPKSHGENEGYNSADEQNPCSGSSYNNDASFIGRPITK